jgi:hypothetical protein
VDGKWNKWWVLPLIVVAYGFVWAGNGLRRIARRVLGLGR